MFPAAGSVLAVPWRGGDERLGLVAAFDSRRYGGFNDEDVWVLRIAAAAAGLVWLQRRTSNELQQARAVAESALSAKDEFLSRMSHELRTPLVAVLGFAEILQLADLPGQYQDAADTILRAGSRLLGLVEDLLEVSRVQTETPAVSVEPVEVALLIGDAVEVLQPLASAREVALGVDPTSGVSGYVLADQASIMRVLVSILAHVITRCEPGTRLTVTITERADSQLRISVTQSGRAMSETDQSRLFDPFESVGVTPPGAEANPGLALPRRLIQAMGGSIGVSSVAGSGTTLWVTLPQVGPPPAQSVSHQP